MLKKKSSTNAIHNLLKCPYLCPFKCKCRQMYLLILKMSFLLNQLKRGSHTLRYPVYWRSWTSLEITSGFFKCDWELKSVNLIRCRSSVLKGLSNSDFISVWNASSNLRCVFQFFLFVLRCQKRANAHWAPLLPFMVSVKLKIKTRVGSCIFRIWAMKPPTYPYLF